MWWKSILLELSGNKWLSSWHCILFFFLHRQISGTGVSWCALWTSCKVPCMFKKKMTMKKKTKERKEGKLRRQEGWAAERERRNCWCEVFHHSSLPEGFRRRPCAEVMVLQVRHHCTHRHLWQDCLFPFCSVALFMVLAKQSACSLSHKNRHESAPWSMEK